LLSKTPIAVIIWRIVSPCKVGKIDIIAQSDPKGRTSCNEFYKPY
jgi:hypothetical protein